MTNVPMIASVETAVTAYYAKPQLGNAEINEIFGGLSKGKVCQLKVLAREKMEELGIPLMNNRTVDADAAYQAWGLNIGDLERRYAKIKKMEENNNGKN